MYGAVITKGTFLIRKKKKHFYRGSIKKVTSFIEGILPVLACITLHHEIIWVVGHLALAVASQ
jgi:hypothetical protein